MLKLSDTEVSGPKGALDPCSEGEVRVIHRIAAKGPQRNEQVSHKAGLPRPPRQGATDHMGVSPNQVR
jgi:hypothetical protein